MKIRYKRPDRKNAISILEAAKKDIDYTFTINISENSSTTIIRNIYECFRMLGDALLVSEGIESEDHLAPIKELTKIQVMTKRPIYLVNNLRKLRHNINYYGYRPNIDEVKDTVSLAKSCFNPLYKEIKKKINS